MKKLKNQVSRIKNLITIYRHLFSKCTFEKSISPRIVICFDGATSHGGLMDRIKGIVSFYAIAKEKKIPFFIHFVYPFNLSVFLDEHKYKWNLPNYKYNPLQDKVVYVMNNFEINPIDIINPEFKGTYFVYANVDHLAKLRPINTVEENTKYWAELYHELFVPSTYLQNAINKLPQEKRVVCHTRFTTLMGDFKDTTSKILSVLEQKKLIELIELHLENIALENSDKKVFVLSDSIKFLNYIQNKKKYNILPGLPKHIDVKNDNNNIDEHLKTFTDFYFMTSSEEVFLIHIPPMYNSAFSKYAAAVGGKQFVKITN